MHHKFDENMQVTDYQSNVRLWFALLTFLLRLVFQRYFKFVVELQIFGQLALNAKSTAMSTYCKQVSE